MTGVQTCALPISSKIYFKFDAGIGSFKNIFEGIDLLGLGNYHVVDRSEERRVGKECRSRWSPYH